jgi:hypothetical protein
MASSRRKVDEFLDKVDEKLTAEITLKIAQRDYRNIWRVGQVFFNVLRDYDPEIARQVHGTDLDPFDEDHRINGLMNYLETTWSAPSTTTGPRGLPCTLSPETRQGPAPWL